MLNFFKCGECDSVMLEMPHAGSVCKSGEMELLQTNVNPEFADKYKPIVTVEDGMVVVRAGSEATRSDHHIEWAFVQTTAGGAWVKLTQEDLPEAFFPGVKPEEVESVYLYCGSHGLWKADEPVLPNYFDMNQVACSPEFAQGCVNPSNDPLS